MTSTTTSLLLVIYMTQRSSLKITNVNKKQMVTIVTGLGFTVFTGKVCWALAPIFLTNNVFETRSAVQTASNCAVEVTRRICKAQSGSILVG